MNTTIKEHTFGQTISAQELHLADVPQDEFHRLYHAAQVLAVMIAGGHVWCVEEGHKEAEDALTDFTGTMDEIWKSHAKPAPVDYDFVGTCVTKMNANEAAERRDAVAAVKRLREVHGDDDQRTKDAIIRGFNMAGPRFTQALAEDGVHLSTEQIAQALQESVV
jgi:hypothetical protein